MRSNIYNPISILGERTWPTTLRKISDVRATWLFSIPGSRGGVRKQKKDNLRCETQRFVDLVCNVTSIYQKQDLPRFLDAREHKRCLRLALHLIHHPPVRISEWVWHTLHSPGSFRPGNGRHPLSRQAVVDLFCVFSNQARALDLVTEEIAALRLYYKPRAVAFLSGKLPGSVSAVSALGDDVCRMILQFAQVEWGFYCWFQLTSVSNPLTLFP